VKVGDLVKREFSTRAVIGVVVVPVFVGPNGERQQLPRVKVLWSNGHGLQWEPVSWLEIVSESQ
jgi:hypothetical protein